MNTLPKTFNDESALLSWVNACGFRLDFRPWEFGDRIGDYQATVVSRHGRKITNLYKSDNHSVYRTSEKPSGDNILAAFDEKYA